MLSKIILASLIEMAVAFAGILFFLASTRRLINHIHLMLSVAVGAFLGIVFFDLLPEALEFGGNGMFLWVLVGFLAFFVLSRTLFWYHHHHNEEESHDHDHPAPRGPMILIGDALHNFVDGALIAFAFMANPALGVATTVAVLIHEFPQELADFFVLLSAGYSRKRALTLNLLSSSATLVGAFLAYFLGTHIEGLLGPALAITAGNFIYLAASDILPGLAHSHGKSSRNTFKQIAAIVFGIVLIFFALKLSGHEHAHEEAGHDVHEDVHIIEETGEHHDEHK
jgi:zinc and cadmium transporter